MLFLANFDPPSPCHTLSHIPRPPKIVRHTSWTPSPIFSRPSTKSPDKSPLYKFSLNCSRGFLSWGLLSGRFCPGWVLSIPPSVRIHPLQQKASLSILGFNCMKKCMKKSVMSHALGPPFPLSQTVTHSRTPSPSSVMYFYGRMHKVGKYECEGWKK